MALAALKRAPELNGKQRQAEVDSPRDEARPDEMRL
jgi:hypothetical protein